MKKTHYNSDLLALDLASNNILHIITEISQYPQSPMFYSFSLISTTESSFITKMAS